MGKRARRRDSACVGKRTYRTWSEAEAEAKAINAKDASRLAVRGLVTAYACPFGSHLHIGHNRPTSDSTAFVPEKPDASTTLGTNQPKSSTSVDSTPGAGVE